MEAKRKSERNSNIEVLRLVAMGLIVLNHLQWGEMHYIDTNWSYIHRMGISQIVTFLSNWGGVGDCLFFGISAWFLCTERQSIRKNIGRCWQLEKQLWFWSILTCGSFIVVRYVQGQADVELAAYWSARALLPFSTNLWWYPTSYMLFLLIAPLLTQGLGYLSKRQHGAICMALIAMYAFLPSRFFPMDMKYSIVLFIYLYIIISFFRWHLPELCKSSKFARDLLAVGIIFGISTQFVVQCFFPNNGYLHYFWLNTPRCLPSICISIALLIFVTTAHSRVSKAVNWLAASTLSVYLVVTTPVGEMVLRTFAKAVHPGVGGIVFNLLMAVIVYLGVLMMDVLRHAVFSKTVDLNELDQLEWIWGYLLRAHDIIASRFRVYVGHVLCLSESSDRSSDSKE